MKTGFSVPKLLFLWSVLVVGSLTCPAEAQPEAEEKPSLHRQIGQALAAEESETAVRLLSQLIAEQPDHAVAYYRRACELFRLGKFEESVRDFDQYVALQPESEKQLWERGISHYYAGKYQAGAEQFALYQTYHDNDVENSVWRFLCMAKDGDLKQAQQQMLPIKDDPRIPLMEIYALFQGRSTPEQVLAAVQVGEPMGQILAGRLFYAQLYLGLYYEAHGQPQLAQQYLHQAWKDHKETRTISRYMWHVARVHAELLNRQNRSE